MKSRCSDFSLVLQTKHRLDVINSQVITLGLLLDAQGSVVASEEAWPWIVQRFGNLPFDCGLKKHRGTFAVHGTAFALTPEQRQGMTVLTQVGKVEKMLHVFPPRYWQKGILGWKAVVSAPLTSVAIDCHHAFGGEGWAANPKGCGFIQGEVEDGVVLPQIEIKEEPLLHPGQCPKTATLMPLLPQNPERACHIGTLDLLWQHTTQPFLPIDSDRRWFDEVPQDQCQNDFWHGDEQWRVVGMHPEHLEITGQLPALRPRLFVERLSGDEATVTEATLDLDTVWLFPDVHHQLLLYRTELPVEDIDGEDLLSVAAVCEKQSTPPRHELDWINELWPAEQAISLLPVEPEIEVPPVLDKKGELQQNGENRSIIDEAFAEADKEMIAIIDDMQKRAPNIDLSKYKAAILAVPNPVDLETEEYPSGMSISEIIDLEIEKGMAQVKEHAAKAGIDIDEFEHSASGDVDKYINDPMLLMSDAISALGDNISEEKKAEFMQSMDEMSALNKELESLSRVGMLPLVDINVKDKTWTREELEESYQNNIFLQKQHFMGLDLCDVYLVGATYHACEFSHCQFDRANVADATFSDCIFRDCQFINSKLQNVCISNAMFENCNFSGTNFKCADFTSSRAEYCDFSGACLASVAGEHAQFRDCIFNDAIADSSRFESGRFMNCKMNGVKFAQSTLTKAQFIDCQIDNAVFSSSVLASVVWSKIKGCSVNLSESDLHDLRMDCECHLPDVDMYNSDLTNISIQNSYLKGAILRQANLEKAWIVRCDLTESDGYRFVGQSADFSRCDLSRAHWVSVNLMDACLRNTCLQNADLRGSNLYAADTEGAYGNDVNLEGVLLTDCRILQDLNDGAQNA